MRHDLRHNGWPPPAVGAIGVVGATGAIGVGAGAAGVVGATGGMGVVGVVGVEAVTLGTFFPFVAVAFLIAVLVAFMACILKKNNTPISARPIPYTAVCIYLPCPSPW